MIDDNEDRETKLRRLELERANRIAKGKQERDAQDEPPVFGPDFVQVLNDSLASSSTAWEQSKKARAANKPTASISIAPRSKHADGEIKGFSNILPVIDAVENEIMEVLKKSGYMKMAKADDYRRFSKSDTDYFDVYKDGSMKSNGVGLDGSLKVISDDMAKKFIDMVCVFQEVANKYGKDLAFPSGPMDMTILKENIRPQDAAKVSIINQFTQDTVIRALSDPKFDAIRDRFTYDGKPIQKINAAADVAEIKTPNSSPSKPNTATETKKRASMENTEALGLTGPAPTGRKKFAYTSNRDELRIKAIKNNLPNKGKLGNAM